MAKRNYKARAKKAWETRRKNAAAKFKDTDEWKLEAPMNVGSIISDLTSTIDKLEAQLTAQIDRIKSILN